MEQSAGPARAVILAGGRSRRMKSGLNKVLHPLCGKEVVAYVLDACADAGIDIVYIITGADGDEFRKRFGNRPVYVSQPEPLGTGHALLQAAGHLSGYYGPVIVLAGDSPLVDAATLRRLLEHRQKTGSAAVLLTAEFDETPAFGRILRDRNGRFCRIVEAKDASEDELRIREVNVTLYCFDTRILLPLLAEIGNDNAQGEYYITDIFEIMLKKGLAVETLQSENPYIGFGINTQEDFERTRALMQSAIIRRLEENGVRVPGAGSVIIDTTVRIGAGSVVESGSSITGATKAGARCIIGPRAIIHNSRIGDDCIIRGQKIMDSTLPDGTILG